MSVPLFENLLQLHNDHLGASIEVPKAHSGDHKNGWKDSLLGAILQSSFVPPFDFLLDYKSVANFQRDFKASSGRVGINSCTKVQTSIAKKEMSMSGFFFVLPIATLGDGFHVLTGVAVAVLSNVRVGRGGKHPPDVGTCPSHPTINMS